MGQVVLRWTFLLLVGWLGGGGITKMSKYGCFLPLFNDLKMTPCCLSKKSWKKNGENGHVDHTGLLAAVRKRKRLSPALL